MISNTYIPIRKLPNSLETCKDFWLQLQAERSEMIRPIVLELNYRHSKLCNELITLVPAPILQRAQQIYDVCLQYIYDAYWPSMDAPPHFLFAAIAGGLLIGLFCLCVYGVIYWLMIAFDKISKRSKEKED